MTVKDEDVGILQNLEFMMMSVWKKHPEMTDHVAARAYEAAYERYRAEARGHQPKPVTLTGLDREAYDAVTEMCEIRLGRQASGAFDGIPPVEISRLAECLRELRKSVERHTRFSGRQGYLNFVSRFIS